MSITYRGFSKRAGRIRVVKSGKSDSKDAKLLYSIFDADTMIDCISKGKIIETCQLDVIFKNPNNGSDN
jgi:hypothetical protein